MGSGPATKPKYLLTSSSSKSFLACRQQWHLAYVRMVRAVRVARPLAFGTAVHKCLQAYWEYRRDRTEPGKGSDAALAAGLAAAPDVMDPFDLARLRVMLAAYAAVWNQVAVRVVFVEKEFRGPLVNPETGAAHPRFERAGKIDLVVELLETGEVVVVEHKTSAMDTGPGTAYHSSLAVDGQVSFYYAGSILLGLRIGGVVYDVLEKPRLKPRRATPPEKRRYTTDKATGEKRLYAKQRAADETPTEFERRMLEKVARDPQKYVRRTTLVRLVEERRRFALEVWQQAEDMTDVLANGRVYRSTGACFRYGSPCQFWAHCGEKARIEDPLLFRAAASAHEELDQEPDDDAGDDADDEQDAA